MTANRWPTILVTALALAAAPLAAQQKPDSSAATGGAEGQGSIQPCQGTMGMMGSRGMMHGGQGTMRPGGMMGGAQGMMGSGSMMGGAQGMMGSGSMMGALPVGPSALLSVADQLGLTDTQKTRLEELSSTALGIHKAHMQAAMAARSAAAEALDGTADLDAYQAALQQAADQMVQAQVELARAGVDARGVLEPSQEARLDELIAAGFTGCGVMRGSGVGGHG